jgi:cellulose synthase/poly-beta-1,6-N-acetylglucosamine synthase-like glycosyltransferase
MTDIEIPYPRDRGFGYRLLEILPGFLSWSVLALPFVFAFVSPYFLAVMIIAYLLAWFIKAVGLNARVLQAYSTMEKHKKIDWTPLIADLDDTKAALWRVDSLANSGEIPEWHRKNLALRSMQPKDDLKTTDVIHAIIIPTYNEAREVLEETIKKVIKTHFNKQQIILIIAPEERGGEQIVTNAHALVKKYKKHFKDAACVPHPPVYEEGEIKGKGANATYAGRWLQKYLDKKKIPYGNVIVTTLDADNRPHPNYLGELTYLYILSPDRITTSYQPISIYTNNIWDAPAAMRVLAIGNSFWMMIVSMRPHMLRNFSAHGQGMQALVDCDFWSRRTIVEDGHQFWRTYFRYDGKHEVYPIFAPIYQDAVLSETYKKTLKAQFVQLQRWAWGASDIAYVISTGFFKKNNVPKWDLFQKTLRLIEGHLSWATAPLILAFAALIPVYVNPSGRESFVANQLPVIASYIQTIAMVGILVTLFLSLKLLPKRPARYKRHRHIWMTLQWVFMPITSIVYSSFAALNAQTRLMLGRYIGKFNVTDKAVKK